MSQHQHAFQPDCVLYPDLFAYTWDKLKKTLGHNAGDVIIACNYYAWGEALKGNYKTSLKALQFTLHCLAHPPRYVIQGSGTGPSATIDYELMPNCPEAVVPYFTKVLQTATHALTPLDPQKSHGNYEELRCLVDLASCYFQKHASTLTFVQTEDALIAVKNLKPHFNKGACRGGPLNGQSNLDKAHQALSAAFRNFSCAVPTLLKTKQDKSPGISPHP